MNIALLSGIPRRHSGGMSAYVEEFSGRLGDNGHSVSKLDLGNMNIKYCAGCFGCFVKTPGLCLIKDDADTVLRTYVQSDLVIMASPVIMGFISAVLKRALDRIIPNALPYVDIYDGELHHPPRYNKRPKLALLLEKEAGTDDEDVDIICSTFDRIVRNAHTKLVFTRLTEHPIEEVCHAVDSI